MGAREKAFLLETVLKAWKKSGIYPLNPNIFTDANFTPSALTSRHAHVLGSYPTGHDSDNSDFKSGSDEEIEPENESDGTTSDSEDDNESGGGVDKTGDMRDCTGPDPEGVPGRELDNDLPPIDSTEHINNLPEMVSNPYTLTHSV
jgi:hypothetical protein